MSQSRSTHGTPHCAARLSSGLVQRFILTVEGPNLDDLEEIELLGLPLEGEPIETRYGTCVVTRTESTPDGTFAGKIYCRMP